jgi:hypothetical protein
MLGGDGLRIECWNTREYTRAHTHTHKGKAIIGFLHVLVILARLSFIIFFVAIIIALISAHFVLLAIYIYFSVLSSKLIRGA